MPHVTFQVTLKKPEVDASEPRQHLRRCGHIEGAISENQYVWFPELQQYVQIDKVLHNPWPSEDMAVPKVVVIVVLDPESFQRLQKTWQWSSV